MKNLILILPFVLIACGESAEQKQERLTKELNQNVNAIKQAGQLKVDSIENAIKLENAKH